VTPLSYYLEKERAGVRQPSPSPLPVREREKIEFFTGI